MKPLATLVLPSGKYVLTHDGWSGPDALVENQLNTLYPLDQYHTSTAVFPPGYEAAQAAGEDFKGQVEWPERPAPIADLIH
jgi:hypothetical protein